MSEVSQVSPFTGRPRTVRPRYDTPLETSPGPTGGTAGKSPVPTGVSAPGPLTPPALVIPEGIFTIEHTDSDEYETIKIQRGTGNFEGKWMAGHINGPNNTTDFQMFCFVNPDGSLKIWSRFQGIDPKWPDAVRTVLGYDRAWRIGAGQAYARRSQRCMICGLPLTTPESLDMGIGPICLGRMAW